MTAKEKLVHGELLVPPMAEDDPKAIEVLRVWVAKGGQHVSINPFIWNEPEAWGIVLADLAGHLANAYMQEAAPWTTLKTDRARAALATRTTLNLVRLGATVAWSIVPDLAARVLNILGDPPISAAPPWPEQVLPALLGQVTAGQSLNSARPLVEKVSLDQLAFAE